MISVEEAIRLLSDSLYTPKIEERDLSNSLFYVLAEDIIAKRSGPPFPRVSMDGIAIRLVDFEQGRREFTVVGIQAAGVKKKSIEKPGTCLEVMTGSILPEGTDVVVQFEELEIINDVATIISPELKQYQNIHAEGFDFKKGDVLLKKGTLIRSPEIAILSSNGIGSVSVYAQPKIAVVATGDELVSLDKQPEDHQIWISNLYSLKVELQAFGLNDITTSHLLDDLSSLKTNLEKILRESDMVILSGGVSKGRYDYIPEVLESLQVKKIFHRVSQRPGQPLYFGKTEDEKLIFGLPGNPVSSVVSLRRYVLPVIWKLVGWEREGYDRIVELQEDFEFSKSLTFFLTVKIKGDLAYPVPVKGSGDYRSLADSDGFVELKKEQSVFKKGEKFKFFKWGALQ